MKITNPKLSDYGNTFWDTVDSQRAFYTTYACACPGKGTPDDHEGDCATRGPGWRETRDDTCIAMRSDNTRCHQIVESGMPFCSLHIRKVIDWVAWNHTGAMTRYFRTQEKNYIDHILRIANEADAIEEDRLLKSKVYFIGIDDKIVKIGRSVDPLSRMAQIRQGSSLMPEGYDRKRVELLGTVPGGSQLESRLHGALSFHRLKGEWFAQHPDVIAVMSYLCLGEMKAEASRVLREAPFRRWWQAEGYLSEAEALEDIEVAS